jgi:gluconate 2-dehydrogenase gamma chain
MTMNIGEASRRQFLLGSVSGLSSAWLALRWPAILAAHEHAQRAEASGRPDQFQFFSPAEAAEVEAMAAQIIPSDDTPGAQEARVVYFIDRTLVTFDREKQPAYTQGLKDLLQRTQLLFPSVNRFSSLTPAQQIQVLTAIEKTDFFELVRLHTIMGYLSRPEYGGNHDQAGWKLIGFENEMTYKPPFGYYDAEENKRE